MCYSRVRLHGVEQRVRGEGALGPLAGTVLAWQVLRVLAPGSCWLELRGNPKGTRVVLCKKNKVLCV